MAQPVEVYNVNGVKFVGVFNTTGQDRIDNTPTWCQYKIYQANLPTNQRIYWASQWMPYAHREGAKEQAERLFFQAKSVVKVPLFDTEGT